MSTPSNGNPRHGIGAVASNVVSSLAATPTLLVLVLLNVFMMGVGAWYLNTQQEHRHKERLEALRMVEEHCFGRKK
jgi:hypothetical protein